MRCECNQQRDDGRCSTREDAAEVSFLVARRRSGRGRGRRARLQSLPRTRPRTVPHAVYHVALRDRSRLLDDRGSAAHDGQRRGGRVSRPAVHRGHGRRRSRRLSRGRRVIRADRHSRLGGHGRGRCDNRRLGGHSRLGRRRCRGDGGNGGSSRGRRGRNDLLDRRGCGGRHVLGRRRPGRQERQRVDIALVVGGRTHAEVHERLRRGHDAAQTDRADDCALAYLRSARHADRAEMNERDRVAERRLDRDGPPSRRNRPGERDDTARRREHIRTRRRSEVDTAMLTRGVRVGMVERERTQDRPVDRPRPGLRRRR
jgi:hypothetical protein